MATTVYVIVPVLNEAANMQRLFAGLEQLGAALSAQARGLHVVLVDDGSTDDTVAQAKQHESTVPLTVLQHAERQGPGAAFATAFAHLHTRLSDNDLAFTIEGDNTSRLGTALHMLTRLGEGYDVVLASPYAYGGGITKTSLYRLALSHAANSFLKGLVGLRGIHTMSSFFRLYRATTLLRLQALFGPRIIEQPGFECMAELLIKMALLHMRISEVEMVLDTSLRSGRSKMKVWRTALGYLGLLKRRSWWQEQVRTAPAAHEASSLAA